MILTPKPQINKNIKSWPNILGLEGASWSYTFWRSGSIPTKCYHLHSPEFSVALQLISGGSLHSQSFTTAIDSPCTQCGSSETILENWGKKTLVSFFMIAPIMSKIIHPLCYFHDPIVNIYLFFFLFVNGKLGPWTKCLDFKTCKYSSCVKILPFPSMIKTLFFHFSH